MAIRKRVSDPEGSDTRVVQRHMREGGRRPVRPPRPSADDDGEELYETFMHFPYQRAMTTQAMSELSLKLLKRKFDIYGTYVQLYPCYSHLPLQEEAVMCSGIIVFLDNPFRVNMKLKLQLKCIPEKWFRLTLDWIESNIYE